MAETTGRIKFDVTQEHRIGGNGATYIIENYKKAVEHPKFQQAIKLGNAFGYRGHPTRKVLKDGKIVYQPVLFPTEKEAVPTHVCRYMAMDGKYCIHEQQFLTDHEEGRIVKSLWDGDTGGFSSRASTDGGYGGRFYPTKLAMMAGMDFVHDRSYRFNSREGVLATESVMHSLSIEYLKDELGINDKAAHFICNGGVCPNPKDLAFEQALFQQVMNNELALEEVYKQEIEDAFKRGELSLEDAHKIAIESAFKQGYSENIDNERKAFNAANEEFIETFKDDHKRELIEAERIAVECINRMPRKPPLEDGFLKIIAPSLIKNGMDRVAIESVFHEIIGPFTGYNLADFKPPTEEFVDVGTVDYNKPSNGHQYWRKGDHLLMPPR